ncbi:hypothetical protein [Acidisphaera rubrifaciens]|uniref:hypothetical protein n=1 Tax=Acidisphaera rubrifaciens TaxID=50715 RepID=UPI0018F1D26C|nr:hypothetical protein [Acidisphaera rubrifaciens]
MWTAEGNAPNLDARRILGTSRKERTMKVKWLDQPQKHDYPAAKSYLSLTLDEATAEAAVREMERAEMRAFAAKDIFRASGLPLLGPTDSHVDSDRVRIIRKESLSPVLLYRDDRRGRLVIADGYHRMCAVYTFDEDAMIPCKIV